MVVVVTERWWRRGSGEKGGQQQRAHSSEHGERGEQQQRAQEQLGRRTRASARGQRRLRVEWPFRSSVLLKRLSLARWAMEKRRPSTPPFDANYYVRRSKKTFAFGRVRYSYY